MKDEIAHLSLIIHFLYSRVTLSDNIVEIPVNQISFPKG